MLMAAAINLDLMLLRSPWLIWIAALALLTEQRR